MLYTETVAPHTLELLKELMADDQLSAFFLVGGTALSLWIGHRISIDFDLFSLQSFDANMLSANLESSNGLQLRYLDKNTIKGSINNIQVDLITHAYPLVADVSAYDGIQIASLEDIAAMKLNAVIGNGTRLKDFVDVAFLSTRLSLSQMTNAYERKYNTRNPFIALKALAYHDEINFDEPVRFISGLYSWKLIQRRLQQMIQSTGKTFDTAPF